GEGVELVHHGVERFLELEDFARHVHSDLLRQVALRHGGCNFGDVAHLSGQVAGHRVDAVGQVLPRSDDGRAGRLAAEPAFGAILARDTRHFAGERVELVHHRVDGVLELQDFTRDVDGDLLGQVAARDGGRDLGDVANLRGQVAGHRIDAVGEVLP